MKQITLELAVMKAKAEVLDLIVEEQIDPKDITSFSDLHNLCDANTLGYLCDGDVSMGEHRVQFVDEQGPIPHDDTDASNDRWMAFGNDLQDRVNVWIKFDGHRAAMAMMR